MGKSERHTPKEKMEIVLHILRNPKKLRELLGRYDIGISTYYKWRNRFFHGGLAELEEYQTGPKSKLVETEKEKELKAKVKTCETRINELSTELEILKKNESWNQEELN